MVTRLSKAQPNVTTTVTNGIHNSLSPDLGPTFSPAQSGGSTPNPGAQYSKKQDIKIQPQQAGNKSLENNGYIIDPFA
jgi:hypothetical protein